MKNKKNRIITIIKSLLILTFLYSCNESKKGAESDTDPDDYRQAMRDFVIGISEYAKSVHPGFVVIPQNGIELVLVDPENTDSIHRPYIDAIDGVGQEDLNYGYIADDVPTPKSEITYINSILKQAKQEGKAILVTDYCSSLSYMDHSYNTNYDSGYISFAANHRGLDNIPEYPLDPFRENAYEVDTLSEARNFLYLIDLQNFDSKQQFVDAIKATDYDLIITDLFLNDSISFNAEDINSLKRKNNNGVRMVVCYMSIGEAEIYRYYWQDSWLANKPIWLKEENPDWEGNYKVKYWNPEWQNIIFGSPGSYLDKILESGFDGVYLDIIDGYEYFE